MTPSGFLSLDPTPGTFRDERSYPLELDGSMAFTRPQTSVYVYAPPPMIGHVEGLLRAFDAQVWMLSRPSKIEGPTLNMSRVGNLEAVFPDLYGGLPKSQ